MYKKLLITGILIYSNFVFGQNFPFPNHTAYTTNHIKPNNYTQTELDSQTAVFYDEWKNEYLKNDCGNANEYYVFYDGNDGGGEHYKTVSEAHGYGMMITVYMAGYDVNAKMYFDGLYAYFRTHPSSINSNLMDWQQKTCSDASNSDNDSASDGDIDIAFSLLLAHSQWGSSGSIDYLSEARLIIDAIMQNEINQETWSVKLGDWSSFDDQNYYYSTRTSDFITGHFRVFSCFTDNTNWDNVINTCYTLIDNMQTNYSATAGLLPDFIINVNTVPNPAGANFLEFAYDGDYYYNACRNPWRLGNDYLINGELRAKAAVTKLNTWLKNSTNANTNNISNGYLLNGTAIYTWHSPAFIGPFTVGAMADVNNQTWLNSLYTDLILNYNFTSGGYYSNTIKLLSMITISGNYWVSGCNTLDISSINKENKVDIYPNKTRGKVTIVFKNIDSEKRIEVIDVYGRSLINIPMLQEKTQLDISSFSTGIYFVSIKSNNRYLITKKLIKE